MFDVITMGSAVVDSFAQTDSELIQITTKMGSEELIAYPLGSKILISELNYNVGGNGLNAAVALSKLGLNVAYLGKIGEDANGEMILEVMEKENVEFIGAKGTQSGFSVILNSELGHDRTILTYKGDANNLIFVEIDQEKLDTKWYYLTSMLGDSFHTMEKVAELGKQKGAKICFNPSATVSKKGRDFLENILQKSDLIILNDEEAEDLVGKGSNEEKIQRFHEIGIEMVIVTLGADGLLASDGKDLYTAKPTPELKVIETTGAGDAFASTFLSGLVMERDFETCIKMGMLNSESVIQHHGAQNKLLTKEEMEERLSQDNREMSKRSY